MKPKCANSEPEGNPGSSGGNAVSEDWSSVFEIPDKPREIRTSSGEERS
jgi:hypothetical protein